MPGADEALPPEVLKELSDNERELKKRESHETNLEDIRRIRKLLKSYSSREIMDKDSVSEFSLEETENLIAMSSEERRQAIFDERASKWDAKVPPAWSGWSLDDLPAHMKAEAGDWMANGFPDGKNLVLLGPPGSGKTAVGYAICRQIYCDGRKVKIWKMAELFEKMRDKDESRKILEQVKEADLLLLDDVGSERKTDWIEERFYMIVDHRYEWQKPMIVTSNLTQEQLALDLSPRVFSRVLSRDTPLLEFPDEDYRA